MPKPTPLSTARRQRPTRRQFIRAAGAAIAAPMIIPASALGLDGRPAPSERIVMGTIGVGGRGGSVMGAFMNNADVQMVAVCDVQADRRRSAKARVDRQYNGTGCTEHIDFRELLDRKDIDAVLIATGDNWHAAASILAARAGKDVYCEKPMSITISESRAVADTFRRLSRIYQCGSQRRNVSHFIVAANLALSGKLGKLHTLHAQKAWPRAGTYSTVLPEEPAPPREVMDFDMWLGPAPWRPYNKRTYSRGFWSEHTDFSGGSITEWGSHTVDLCQWANNSDHTGPTHYEVMNKQNDVQCTYADGVKLIIRTGLRFGTCPVRYEGDEGYVEVGDSGQMEVSPASLQDERRFKGGYPAGDHAREFLDSVKSRQPTKCNPDVAHRSITVCHVANICVTLKRPLQWDPVAERFVNDEQANRMIQRTIRQPWRV